MRYIRQEMIPDFGTQGQQLLAEASVLVVGAGGLGSPVAVYLAAAGVGRIGLADGDKIEFSNLHRQVWFHEDQVGLFKVDVLSNFIQNQNPNTIIEKYPEMLTIENGANLIKKYDVIIDGSDNFPTRYLVNDLCVSYEKPLVFGAIFQFEGQVSVFNQKVDGTMGPNYRDVFAEPPNPNEIPNCNEGGVIGMLPGIIGTTMAMETVKVICNVGDTLSGYLLSIDARYMEFYKIKIKKSFDNNLIDPLSTNYNYVCDTEIKTSNMKSINIKEYKELKEKGTPFQLIDVREPQEYEESNMGGQLMPMSEIHKHVNNIEDDIMVIVQCRSGARSASVIEYLSKEHGFDNLYNLEGGILAWHADQ